MDDELKTHDRSDPKEPDIAEQWNSRDAGLDVQTYRRKQIEDSYLDPLLKLGDQRIAAELDARSKSAKTPRVRKRFADLAARLRQSKSID